VDVRRRVLLDSETLQIGLFEMRPASDACGDVERQNLNAIVLPFAGLGALPYAIYVLAALTAVTVVQRMLYVRRQLTTTSEG